MAIKTFASIYIGSFEVSMKIFEFSSKKSIRTIDNVDARLDLGKDSFVNRNLGYEIVDQLCDILSQFKEIMQGYKVDDYEIYTSSVLRDSSNALFVLDQIHLRTGFTVNVISNSEHRFLSYKSVAGQARFEGIVSHHAAVNIGGGMRLDDPSADLGIVFALVSSFKNRAIPSDMVMFGEMGLSGEVRGVSGAEQRVREAAKMGFKTCIIPKSNMDNVKKMKDLGDMKVVGVANIQQALEYI